ncbi:hypothetical protein VFPFJ_04037 [Purpureocillium lilacinum]|uniref:Uncharacterized protein n=1 Tax=Purpureocillium lilacinum TaxID=33203 RepID=A0A179HPN2_PURLI|nr:hypothetical protein VFPFJ_04037 [Purpureocillium lilacinum]OAQ92297.1 hypothetical protein VFPFJ_04037 [Purpureocillium lilacinum]
MHCDPDGVLGAGLHLTAAACQVDTRCCLLNNTKSPTRPDTSDSWRISSARAREQGRKLIYLQTWIPHTTGPAPLRPARRSPHPPAADHVGIGGAGGPAAGRDGGAGERGRVRAGEGGGAVQARGRGAGAAAGPVQDHGDAALRGGGAVPAAEAALQGHGQRVPVRQLGVRAVAG